MSFLKLSPTSYRSIVFDEINIAATSNAHGISERNDSLLRIEYNVTMYAYSDFTDRDIPWVLSFSAEYNFIWTMFAKEPSLS